MTAHFFIEFIRWFPEFSVTCNSISGKPGKYFDEINKEIDCPALFSNPDMDIPSQFKEPPIKIPKWLLDDYSYHGKVEINNGFHSKTSESSSVTPE